MSVWHRSIRMTFISSVLEIKCLMIRFGSGSDSLTAAYRIATEQLFTLARFGHISFAFSGSLISASREIK